MSSTTSNSTDKLPDFVHVFSVEEHAYWKPKILRSIEKMIEINNIQLNEKGYYYDFNIPRANRTYKHLIYNVLLSYLDDLSNIYGSRFKTDQNLWFQQYFNNSDFGWHHHDKHFAFIYYIELPEFSETTEFLNYGQFNVKEGDIIFFPTFLVHRSPLIKSNKRKTIVAGNLSSTVDRGLIEEHGKEYFRNR